MVGLEIFWYIIVITAIACYSMLDGFDLGVGSLHLFAKNDTERRIFLNAIGPVWDGNEVWLVVVIGGLFAGFPFVYATLLSAFYTPMIIWICGLIFRAVAIEFRSKHPHPVWRKTWDVLFCGASLLISFGAGVVMGNLIHGIPLDEHNNYIGGILIPFLNPYAVLVGVLAIALFMMHGAIYLVMKTEGELQLKLERWLTPTIIFFIIVYGVTTVVTLIYQPHMAEHLRVRPYLFIVVLANIISIGAIPYLTKIGNHGWAFIASCANIIFLTVLFALGLFPDLIRSSIDPVSNSLTVFNASASDKTLMILLIIALIGIPLVIAYGFYVYRIFRGKVKIDHMSY